MKHKLPSSQSTNRVLSQIVSRQHLSSYFRLLIIIVGLSIGKQAAGQVSGYTFAASNTPYVSQQTGSTVVYATTWDDNAIVSVNLPFNFIFNGNSYAAIKVSPNGYITFGTTAPATTGYTAISSATAYAGAVSAMSKDLGDVSGGSKAIVSNTIGTAPNRKFYIEWTTARAFNSGTSLTSSLSFQIVLNEATNIININYGTNTTSTQFNPSPQVGLRGATNADFKNLSGTNWAAPTVGGANTNASAMTFSSGGGPATGQVYTFTPPARPYASYFYAMSLGSTTWCSTESRNVTVSVKNVGSATWSTTQPINIGAKWNEDADYGSAPNNIGRVSSTIGSPSGPVAPGSTVTYTFTNIPISKVNGTNNLTFDIVYEGVSWFGDNGTVGAVIVGPGNVKFISPAQTIIAPAVSNTPLTQTICSGVPSTLVTLTSPAAGTTFAWTASATANVSGFIASGTNTIPAQTISTTATTQGTVTYSVTPTASGCVGPVTNYTTLVNPKPNVTNSPLTQAAICSGSSSTLVTLTSGVGGASFAWNASATSGVSGFTASGTSTIPAQTISTTATTQGTVTYAITPSANGCAGPISNYIVSVNPKPSVSNTPLTQSVCSGTPSSLVTLTSGVSGTTFAWNASATTGISGFTTNGTSTIPAQTLSTNTSAQGTVTYPITPTANGCTGAITNYTITVTPVPAINPMSGIACSGSAFTVLPANGTNGVVPPGTTYSWAPATVTGGVTGSGTVNNASNISETLTNPTNTSQTATYNVTPGLNGCAGASFTVTVTVNPKPTLTSTLTPTAICSNTLFTYSPSSGVSGTTFTWTRAAVTGISNTAVTTAQSSDASETLLNTTNAAVNVVYAYTLTANGCSNTQNVTVSVNPVPAISNIISTMCSAATFTSTPANGTNGTVPAGTTYSWPAPSLSAGLTGGVASSGSPTSISGTLTNSTNTVQTATYTVTSNTATCPGNTFTVTVTVNPKATISAMASAICSAAGFSVTPVNGTNGIVPSSTTYSWSAPVNANITGLAAGSAQANISGTPTNNSNTVQTVIYSVTPTSPGSCAGTAFNVTVTVNPKATITAMTAAICSEATFTASPANVTNGTVPSGTTYSWSTPVVTGGVTGGAAGNGAPSITGTLVNPTAALQTATYTVTPLAGSCTGATFTVTVTVKPLPNAQGTTICQNATGSLTSSTSCLPNAPVTVGPSFPGTGANNGTGTAWTNPTNVVANDNANVTISANASGTSGTVTATSQNLIASQFGFNIPLTAIINGIQVTIGRNTSTTGLNFGSVKDNLVQLVKAGAVVGTNNGVTGTNWPTSETPLNYPSAGPNLWGTTWNPSEINATTFGVALKVDVSANLFSTAIANVDYIQIAVTYTLPGSLNWYTISSGGTLIGSGSPFNPAGVLNSGLANTNTPGTTTFYAECSTVPGCRTAADFIITASTSIATQPATPAAVCSGNGTRTLSVVASGTGTVTYSWRKAGVPVSNDAVVSGQGTSVLTLINPTAANAGNYDVLVNSACGSITSGAVTVTVNSLPSISVQPNAPAATCSGSGTQTISVTASGTGISYSWRKDGVPVTNGSGISGQGTATLTLTNPTTANAGSYDVVITGTCSPAVTSNAVIVTINTAPSITANPIVPVATCAGTGIQTLSVTATGTGLSYSWRKTGVAVTDGAVISGQGTNTLTLSNPTTADAGSYDVVVSGTCSPSATSTAVSVSINTAPSITGQPVTPAATCSGSGTQIISVTATGIGLTYSWRKGGIPVVDGSVISGQGSNALTLTNPTAADAGSYDVVVSGVCTPSETSSAVTVTVNENAVITVPAAPTSQTVLVNDPSPTNLTVTATGAALTYQWFSNGSNSNAGGTTVGAANGGQTNTFTPPTNVLGTKYYYAVVTSTCGTVTSSAVAVTITNTNTWKGGGTSNWSLGTNWTSGLVPTGANDAAIPVGNTPYPVLSASSSINDLIIDPGATVGIGAGNTFTITGVVSGAGTISGSVNSNLITSASTTLNFTPGANTLKNLTVAAGTTTLSNALNITGGTAANTYGTVTVAPGATLASGGNLTIKSNQFGTARVAAGDVAGNYITGDVTVERYIPQNSKRAWRLLSVPTKGTKTIKQTWQENQAAGANGTPGFGTIITSNIATAAPLQAAGFDAYSQLPSMQSYNSATQGWVYVTSTNAAPIQSNKGYFLYIRGDRSVSTSSSTDAASATTLRTTGTLYQGNSNPAVSIAAGKFEPVGNTFASAIDFTSLSKTGGISNTFYVWDSKLLSGTTLGAYQTFNGSIGYTPATPGGSYPAGVPNTSIESGEAFMLGATGTAGTVTLVEASKTTGNQFTPFRPAALPAQFKTSLLKVNGSTTVLADNNIVVFDNAYKNAVDADDALKIQKAGETMSIVTDGKALIIDARQPVSSTDVISFNVSNLQPQAYKLSFSTQHMNTAGLTAFVEDKYLQTSTAINLDGVSDYGFTAEAGNAASVAADRFRVVFKKAGATAIAATKTGFTISPNPVEGGVVNVQFKNQLAGKYSIRLLDAGGAVIFSTFATHGGGSSTQVLSLPGGVARGVYQLEITSPSKVRELQTLFINSIK